MSEEYNMDNIIYVTNLIGAEDLLLGEGIVQQNRDGEPVNLTKINAHNLPYRNPQGQLVTIGQALDDIYAKMNS